MEEESFEDVEIARFLNEHYVVIKVDREERPDVDAIYMNAVQKLTGGGGWPMTVWLTPERKPFYGGTYYPAARRRPRRRSRLPHAAAEAGERLSRTAAARSPTAADALARSMRAEPAPARRRRATARAAPLLRAAAAAAARELRCRSTAASAARRSFPAACRSSCLLRDHRRTGDAASAAMVERHARADGGAAASTTTSAAASTATRPTRDWLVPHFEKMLYDNALLAVAYLEAYQVTGRADFAGVARDILALRRARDDSPDGAFYSATDADSPAPNGRARKGGSSPGRRPRSRRRSAAERARAIAGVLRRHAPRATSTAATSFTRRARRGRRNASSGSHPRGSRPGSRNRSGSVRRAAEASARRSATTRSCRRGTV